MTSFPQTEANRRNARKSTGPVTEEGKQRSRCNAVRHGLTAETVIGALEDAEDYKAFEAAIIAAYDAQSAVERELVLRLAGLLWRLRRATTMETGLFEIQADHMSGVMPAGQVYRASREVVYAPFGRTDSGRLDHDPPSLRITNETDPAPSSMPTVEPVVHPNAEFARCFLRLANLPNHALDPSLERRSVGGRTAIADGIDKSRLTHPEPRRFRDKEHVRFVAKQPCLICGRRPADPHHLRFEQHHALGRKVSDEFTVPLCRGHHRELHRSGDEAAWWKDAGLDPTIIARALWLETHPPPTRADKMGSERATSLAGVATAERQTRSAAQQTRPKRRNEAN
jgi:hypothetical protein